MRYAAGSAVFSDKRMHIAIIGKSNYEYITCLSGILISGNVAVPFAPDISVEEAAELFKRADIEMLLYEDEFAENAEKLKELCPFLRFSVNLGNGEEFDRIYTDYSENSGMRRFLTLRLIKMPAALSFLHPAQRA